jgi:hypothetical protein
MLATIQNDLTILAATLLVVGVICTPVRNDGFQRGLGIVCLITGVILGCLTQFSRVLADDAPPKTNTALKR